jgi:hypothetical protein
MPQSTHFIVDNVEAEDAHGVIHVEVARQSPRGKLTAETREGMLLILRNDRILVDCAYEVTVGKSEHIGLGRSKWSS